MDQTSETEKVYQRNKYNEIIEMLLTAGYFRARINTLSEFDKVVGGLCWCITSSGELVDVDILFQENSTIGQKIALSEAVVKALRKMGCPAPLQPHQIQGGVGGSDYPALHSAIVWLIKKYFERRGEREEQLRDISTFQFSKNYQLPVEEFSGVSINLAHILDRSKATRAYKRKETLHESEETRVRSCLLEYGETFATKGGDGSSSSSSGGSKSVTGGDVGGSLSDQIVKAAGKQAEKAKVADAAGGGAGGDGGAGSSGGGTRINLNASAVDVSMAGLSKLDVTELSAFEKQLAKAAAQAKKEELAHAEQASREETEIMKQMSQIDEGTATAVSGSQIGNIVGMGSSEIGSAAAAYQAELEQAKKEMENNLASGKMGQAAAFTRQRQNLTQQRDEFVARGMEAKAASEAMIEKLRVIEEERDEAVEHIEQLRGVLAKLTHLESNSMQQDELVTLKNLVSINEALKAQELAFKASCKAQMQDYMARIKAFDGEADENADENKKLRDIEDIHAKVCIIYCIAVNSTKAVVFYNSPQYKIISAHYCFVLFVSCCFVLDISCSVWL